MNISYFWTSSAVCILSPILGHALVHSFARDKLQGERLNAATAAAAASAAASAASIVVTVDVGTGCHRQESAPGYECHARRRVVFSKKQMLSNVHSRESGAQHPHPCPSRHSCECSRRERVGDVARVGWAYVGRRICRCC